MIENQKAQGDILFNPIKELPEGAKKIESNIVAFGEATGHHHAVELAEIYELDDQMWIVAEEGAIVTHQEHATFPLAPGIYEIRIQEEPDPFTGLNRRVLD